MNDAKWVKVINALSGKEGLVRHCDVKLVWDENIRTMWIDGASYRFDYYEHAVEGMISGPPPGWYDYREIEWIQFPDMIEEFVNPNNLKAGTKIVRQNVGEIAETVLTLGQLETEWIGRTFRIYGYK